LQELIWPSISPLSGSFKFYKLRELWWIDNCNKNMEALFSFLKLCPSLEQLFVTVCVLIRDLLNICSALVVNLSDIIHFSLTDMQIDPESYSSEGTNSCLMKETKCTELQHLKLIKFIGFPCPKDEISLAKGLIHMIKGKPPKINTSDGNFLDAASVQ